MKKITLIFYFLFDILFRIKEIMNFNLKIKTHQNIVYGLQNISLVYVVFLWGNLNVFSQTNVTYTMQTGNFNALPTEKNINPPYAGTYNNGATEIGQYANNGSFGNTPGAAAFQTFSSTGVGSGTARTLKVGDRFTVTCYVASNPSAGGYIGISFRASTTYTNFFSATDASTVARFQLDNTGNWKVYSGSSVVATSSSGPNADRTFSIEITSSNTFNATIGSETFYDLSFGTAGPISSFSIYTYGDSNDNSFWKNGSLSNFGHSAGDGLRFGYGLSGSSSSSISGIVSDGINTNSTATSLANVVRVGGASGSSVTLSGANTFTGLTTVNPNATLRLGASSTATNSGPLGTTGAGTTVTSGGVLDMNGFSLTSTATEALTINGTGISSGGALINSSGTGSTWTGTVALGSDASVGGSGSLTISGVISGTSRTFTKVGAGTLTLSATNSITGNWVIGNGTLSFSSFASHLNNQPYTIGTATTSGKLLYTSAGAGGLSSVAYSVAAGGGVIELSNANNLTLSSNATLSGTLTTICSAAGNLTLSGILSGSGGLTVTNSGAGETVLSAVNTYTGTTTVNQGTLRISGADRISNSSNLVLNGGSFKTGSTTGNSETMGTIVVTENSAIYLGTGNHTLTFSASSGLWTSGKTLTVYGWTGTSGASGSAGKIIVGTDATGLDASALEAITFDGYGPGATILSTGEVVPTAVVTIMSTTTGGNWNATGTWVGGVVPGLTDNVRIQPGATVTVTANASCKQLEMAYVASGAGTYTSTLIVNSSVTLAVTGSVFVTTGDDRNKTANIQGAGTLTCASVSLGTNITPTFDRSNTLNSTITNWTCSGTLSIYGNDNSTSEHRATFNLQSGTLTVAGISQTVEGDSDATFTTASAPQSGTLNLTGATPFTLSGSPTTTLNGTTATVSYQREGDQTVLATTYRNLIIANSGVKTTGGAFTVSGTLTVNSGATFATGHAITTSSAASINGTLRINSGGSISAAPNYVASSTLVYNTGGNYNRGVEWSATSGAGYPANVQISHPGTGTTNLLMLTTAAQCSGNLTLDASTSITTTTGGLTVLGNVIFNGSYTLGGDLFIGGNYTVGASPTVNNNSKAVRFTHATADQTITRTGGGTVFFDYLLIEKATSGNVVIATSTDIEINATSGNVLQLNNTGGLDLNGRKLTLNNSGGGIYVNGNRTITSGVAGGDITITNYKFVANNSGTGRLSIGQNVTVNLSANGNIDFGSSGGAITTIEGVLSINSTTSCFVNTNAPIYGSSSTLRYNSGGTYGRGVEWTTATSGAGYPNNVQISNNTTLNIVNASGAYRRAAGNLTVGSGSTFSIPDLTSGSSSVGVEFLGNIINDGTISLNTGSNTTNQRLKAVNLTNGNSNTTAVVNLSGAIGGDLELTGNYTDNATFTANSRAVFFTGTGTQVISGTATAPFNIDYIYVGKASGSVRIDVDLLTGAPAGGIGITLLNATDIFDLNGRTFTLGTNSQTCTFAGSGSFRGSSSSSMIINGTGAFGSLNFESGNRTLNNLTVNRSSTGSVSLGSALTIGGALTLTDGTFIVGANTLTCSGTVARTSGTINASNASATLAFTNTTPLTLPTSVFTGNVNNLTIIGAGGITLGSATTIAGTLTITNGNLNLGTNIHSAGSLSLGGETQTTATSYGGTGSPAETINTTFFAATMGVVNVGSCTDYSITSTTVTSSCAAGASIILANTITSNLPTGTYTVYYTLNGTNTGSYNATMSVNTAGSGTFSTGNLNIGSTTITIDYLRYGCVSKPVSGNSATFTVNANNSSGTASSTPTLCINTALTAITHTTTGATGISNSGVSGANGLPTGVSASWTSNSITITGAPSVSGTFNYSIPLTGGCGTVSANGTITVIALPASAGSNGSLSVCSTTTLTTAMLFAALTGSPAAGGTWSPAIPGSGSVAGVYTYTQMAISPCTPDNTATVTVAVQEPPASAGNNGTLLLCAGTTLTTNVLYDALTGTPVQGGVWSPSIPVSGSVAGTYTYTQVATSPCTVNNTAEVTVNESLTAIWNGNTWSPNTPDSTNSILFSGAFTSTEDIQACSLTVTNNATVIIDGHKVTLSGALVTDLGSSITFNNNSMLLQTGSGYNNSGVINFKKSSSPIFRLDYTLWTSPVLGQNLFNFSPLTLTNRFYTYNETTNFYTSNDVYTPGNPGLNSGSNFLIGRGYLVRSPNNWVSNPGTAASWTGTFTGVPNTGDIAISISKSTGANYGYNAVGNPYPSPISIADFLNDNSNIINSTLWFFRKTNGVSGSAYVTFSNGTYSSGPENNYNIQPGQGFFVKALNSGLLQFKNTQRIGTNGRFFRYNVQTNNVDAGRYWLNLFNNDILVGNLAIAYKDGATNDFDVDFDGEYINDSQMALTSYTSGKELAVQHRATPFSNTDVVPLSFKTDLAGTFTIGFNGSDGVLSSQDIYLEDLLLGQSIAIKTTPYTFVSEAGNFTNRFRITYINNALGTNNTIFNSNQVVVYKNELNNNLVVNSGNVIMSKIKVFDVRGRLLEELMDLNATEANISCGSANEMLLIQVISQDDVSVIKKVVR